MAESVGTIRAQMVLDVRKALENFTAVRLANLQTVTALRTGGGALVTAGAGMAAVGAGMLYALFQAADAAAEFERQLDFFGAVANATEAEMEAVRIKALELGEDTIYSAGQIADSFVELGKAGVSSTDIINGVGEAVANLGAAADIPLDTAANIILSAVQTFGLAASDSVAVADRLAGAANASIVEVEDLGLSLKYAGGVANSLGIPLNDVIDAFALLGTYGIKGSTAGTAMRQMLVSLGGNSDKAKNQLKELGIITEDGTNRFYDAAGSAKPLSEIFQILQDATAGYSDEQKVAAFRTIFQNRALSAALSLTKSGAEGFETMSAAVAETSALEVAGKRLNNLSGDLEILQGNFETLAIKTGTEVQSFLRGLVQGLTSVVQWFGNLSPEMQRFIIWATAIIAVGLIILGVITAFAGSILILIAAAKQLWPAVQLLIGIFRAAAVATWTFNTALLANPITWIVIAIVALVAALIWFFTQTEVGKKAWSTFIGWLTTAWNAVLDFFQAIPGWFSNLWTSIKDKATSIWNTVVEFIKSIPQRMVDAFLNFTLIGLLIQHWDTIWATIQEVWGNILTFFQELPGKVLQFFQELPAKLGYIIGFAIGSVLSILLEFRTRAWEILTTAFNNIVDFFAKLPGRLRDIFTTVYNWVREKMIEIAVFLIIKAMEIYNGVVDWFKKLPGRIRDFFVQMYEWAKEKFIQMAVYVYTKSQEIYNGVIDWFKKLPGRVRDLLVKVVDWVKDKFNQAKDKAVEIAENIYNGVVDWVTDIPNKVKEIFQDAIDNVTDFVSQAWDAAKEFGSGLWEGFKDGMGINSPSFIEKAMWQMTGVLDEETTRMKTQVKTIQGMGKDISDVGNTLGEGFDHTLSQNLNGVQQQIRAVMAYQDQLKTIAASTSADARMRAVGASSSSTPVVVKEGNQVHLAVDWHAAPNDEVSTREQAREMLGRTATILGPDLEDDDER